MVSWLIKLLRVIGWILVVLIVLAVAGCWALKTALEKSLESKTDPSEYSGIVALRKQMSPPTLYSFLPASIPSDATDVEFFYEPVGGHLLLKVVLPEDSFAAVVRDLEASGRTVVLPKDVPTFLIDCYPDTMSHGATTVEPLPSDFEIYLFRTDLDDIQKNWNHNTFAGTAILRDTREVVYHIYVW